MPRSPKGCPANACRSFPALKSTHHQKRRNTRLLLLFSTAAKLDYRGHGQHREPPCSLGSTYSNEPNMHGLAGHHAAPADRAGTHVRSSTWARCRRRLRYAEDRAAARNCAGLRPHGRHPHRCAAGGRCPRRSCLPRESRRLRPGDSGGGRASRSRSGAGRCSTLGHSATGIATATAIASARRKIADAGAGVRRPALAARDERRAVEAQHGCDRARGSRSSSKAGRS